MDDVVWEKRTKRLIVQIVTTPNWKPLYKKRGGIPINPNIPKWLVKLIDLFTHDEFCPTDEELTDYCIHTYDEESLKLIVEAFMVKEKHNRSNLKNPEDRKKERIFRKLVKSAGSNVKTKFDKINSLIDKGFWEAYTR